MTIKTIRVRSATCMRCGHSWILRKPGRPVKCPGCSDESWDKKRIYKRRKGVPKKRKARRRS